MFICSICNLFGGKTYATVLRHIGEIHRYDANLNIRCGINYCPQTYNNYESFRSHVYRKHRDVLVSHDSAIDTGEENATAIVNDEESGESLNDDIDIQMYHEPPDRKKNAAKFLLKIREQYRIPQSTLNNIVSDLKGLWTVSMESVKERLENHLQSNSENAVLLGCCDNAFPLDGLHSEHMQLKYYKENFNYLVST